MSSHPFTPAFAAPTVPPAPRRARRIAVLPGDGIGVEVMAEAVRVLRVVEQMTTGLCLQLDEWPAGAGEYQRSGEALPERTLTACREADAILLGAMGWPAVRWPDGREIAPQLDLREQLDLYCGLRPVRLYHETDTPLKHRQAGEIDLVIVRENTEGLFSSRQARSSPGVSEVRDELLVSRRGSERLFRSAFREAQRRSAARGGRPCRVTLVDKANVLPSMVLFRAIFDEVAAEFPDVPAERMYVDAAALQLVQRPQAFDVLVTENMFGDILSDLAAGLVGGLGLAPSADVGDGRALFQPVHGTAPDIAGREIANPIAMILSAGLMLDWLGGEACLAVAARIRHAVAAALQDPTHRTPDLGGSLSTRQMTDAVLSCL